MDRAFSLVFFWGSVVFWGGLVLLGLVAWFKWWVTAGEREERRIRQAMEARDRARYAMERSWVASDGWPLTHYEVYPSDWELTQDLARLTAMGYGVEWQEHTGAGIAVTYSLTTAYRPAAAWP
ncbi:MAG: hypothetical protein M3072_00375 [Candidatus Dormibacteraeota bacterium]|nr:hypothetical protein [Candidatus Dormibacteraeota bacterium]